MDPNALQAELAAAKAKREAKKAAQTSNPEASAQKPIAQTNSKSSAPMSLMDQLKLKQQTKTEVTPEVKESIAPSINANEAVTAPISAPPSSSDDKYAKYKTMQKLNLPDGAIRQKMTGDGFKSDEIDTFLSSNSSAALAPTSTLPPKEQPKSTPPPPAAKPSPSLKVEPKSSPSPPPPPSLAKPVSVPPITATPAAPAPSSSDGGKYDKYKTMQRMNVPEGAIRQKMSGDGFPAAEIDAFLSTSGGGGAQGIATAPVGVSSKAPLTPKMKPSTSAEFTKPPTSPSSKLSPLAMDIDQSSSLFSSPSGSPMARAPLTPMTDKASTAYDARQTSPEQRRSSGKARLEDFAERKRKGDEALRREMVAAGLSEDVIDSFFSGRSSVRVSRPHYPLTTRYLIILAILTTKDSWRRR